MAANLKVVETDHDAILRDELRTLIQQRDLSKARRDATADAVERANTFCGNLESHLAKFDAVAERVSKARTEAFRKSLLDGAALPVLSLSNELTKANSERLDVENQLNAARDARASLATELETENAELDTLEANVKNAAKKIVANYGDMLAMKLKNMETEIGALRRRLMGVTQMRSPDIGSYPVNSETVMMLRGGPNMATNASADDVQFWDGWLHRLMVDADARPEP